MYKSFLISALLLTVILGGCALKVSENIDVGRGETIQLENIQTNGITGKMDQINVKLVSDDETISVVSDEDDKCGPRNGDTTVTGKYKLEVEGKQGIVDELELGQLSFGGEIAKNVDMLEIGDKTFLIYYQAVDCATIKAYFVLYDQKKGLEKVDVYYPNIDEVDDSLMTINKIDQVNIENNGLNITTFPNGIGMPYDLYYIFNEDNQRENQAIVEYESTDFELVPSNLEASTGEYSLIKSEDFYSIQPKFVDQEVLKNMQTLEGYEGVQNIHFDNGVSIDLYEFTEASSFENIINITLNDKQVYLFTHVINYVISSDGRYLYLDNYVYDQSLDAFQEHWRVVDILKKQKKELPYNYCLYRNGGRSFEQNKLISYGQASENESYGNVETEICIVDLDTLTMEKYLTQTSRMACSVACPVDRIGLLPNDEYTLYIHRADPNYFDDFEQSDDEISTSVLSLYDIGPINQGYRDQKHIYTWNEALENIDYAQIGLDSDISLYLNVKTVDENNE